MDPGRLERALPVAWEIREWNAVLCSSAWLAIAYLKLGKADDAKRILASGAQGGSVVALRRRGRRGWLRAWCRILAGCRLGLSSTLPSGDIGGLWV